MAKRGKGGDKRKPQRLTRTRTPSNKQPDDLWRLRRAGARNIAGVRYQLRLTLAVLVRAAHSEFPATALIPEGLEDIDTVPPRGRARRYLQAKEIAPGSDRTLGVGDLADFLEHVIPILRADGAVTAALVTNGGFGTGLCETGWDRTTVDVIDAAVVSTVADATDGVTADELTELLTRVHLVRDDADLAAVVHDLAARRNIAPAVAQLALDRCLGVVLDTSAAQAGASPANATPLTLNDLDAAVDTATRTAATAALPPEAIAGVATPLTFDKPSPLSEQQFLDGIDVKPEHIAAGLDVRREDHLTQIAEALRDASLAIVVGPSGAGKSALLWRTAADHASRMRVWRVHRLRPDDVDSLLAAVRQQQPSPALPLLVCVDDVGRPGTAGWAEAVTALLELPGVAVVGAAREEDFTIDLALRRAVLVRPMLDRATARHIADVLYKRGAEPAISVDEALPRAKGRLMEFLRLLLGSERLDVVLAEQAAALAAPDRDVELQVARYVTAAHIVGLDVAATTMSKRFTGPGLAAALQCLVDEHLLVETDTGRWTGLHEIRSEVLARHLHRTPPPRLADTLALVLADADSAAGAGRLPIILAAADDPGPLAPVIADRAAQADAATAAAWLEAARLADVANHAHACVAKANRLPLPTGMSPPQWLSLAHASRFAGIDMSILPATFHEMAAELPDAAGTLHTDAASGLSADEWLRRVVDAEPQHRARLLEALEGAVSWNAAAAPALAATVPDDLLLAARIIASSNRGCTDDAARNALRAALAPPGVRLQMLRDQWSLVTRADYDDMRDAAVVRVIHPVHGDMSAETIAADLAFTVLDVLPEAAVAEVTVTRYDDEPITLHGNSGPPKAIPRENHHPQQVTRWNRAFHDAVEREYTSASLTARLRAQADLVALARQVVIGAAERIMASDDHRRTQRRWSVRVDQLRRDVAALRGLPKDVDLALVPLGSEPRRRDDPAAQALDLIAIATGQLADAVADPARSARGPHLGGIAAQLRDAAAHYQAALDVGAARLAGVVDPLDPALLPLLLDTATVAFNAKDAATLPEVASGVDIDVVATAAERVRDQQQRDERRILTGALASVPGVDATDARLVSAGDRPMLVADPRRWLLPVPCDRLDAAAAALHAAVASTAGADSLAFRVIVVPARHGQVVNYTGTVIGTADVFPVAIDVVRQLVAEAGLTLRPGRCVDEVASVIAALGTAARAIDAARALAGSAQVAQLTERGQTELAAARAIIDGIDVPEAATPLREVADAVAARLEGEDRPSLADEFDDLLAGAAMGPLITRLELAAEAAGLAD